jgi:hypothetical protein
MVYSHILQYLRLNAVLHFIFLSCRLDFIKRGLHHTDDEHISQKFDILAHVEIFSFIFLFGICVTNLTCYSC